jgi:hypothetical protein
MKTDLERGFDNLLGENDRHRRGYQYQKWLHELLTRAGFEVHANPQMAKPRQTDIYARRASHDYLIEAKWRQAPVDVSDIDALRSRLGRTPSDVIGCFFNLSDYRPTAISAVQDDRTREILLFNAEEIHDLARSPGKLSELIEDKRASLRVHARVKFASAKAENVLSAEVRLPSSELQFWCNGSATSSVSSATDNMDIVFTQEHLDPVGSPDGPEFALRLDLGVRHLPELHQVLGTLHNYLDLSGTGTFAIHQTRACWHGVGAESFLSDAAAWQSRYKETKLEYFHHSEDLHYIDEFRHGQLILTARQRVGESVFLHSAEVELRLPGIPVDRESLLELCRKTGNRDAVLTLQEKSFDHLRLRSDRLVLEPVGLIHSSRFTGDTAVSGIIAKNPFFRKPGALKKAGLKQESSIQHLSGTEILCCALNDWHDLGDIADEYYLTAIQSKWLGPALVVRPSCTWRAITKRSKKWSAPAAARKTADSRRRRPAGRTKPKP